MSPRRLPSLAALRSFEAAGRHQSFKDAARELHLTPSAISHQIQRLEADLGLRLFQRGTRSITLTPVGAAYLIEITRAFDGIARATRDCKTTTHHHVVHLALLASFAGHWLAPRLGQFQAEHPTIDLRLETGIAIQSFGHEGPDLAVRYGNGQWQDGTVHRLFTEYLAPVMAPALKASGPPLRTADDLRHYRLLASSGHLLQEWAPWADRHGLSLAGIPLVNLHDYTIAIEAALTGQGIAMGRTRLIAPLLDQGRLVTVLTKPEPLDTIGHWLVVPQGRPRPETQIVIDWLLTEGRMDD